MREKQRIQSEVKKMGASKEAREQMNPTSDKERPGILSSASVKLKVMCRNLDGLVAIGNELEFKD